MVHAVRASAETDAVEWLMDGTAARGVVTIVAQETNDAIDALCASLDYAVRLASGVPKKIVSEEPETKGAIAELRVGRRAESCAVSLWMTPIALPSARCSR